MSKPDAGVLIGPELNAAFNEHLGLELFSSHQYLNIAAYFDDRALRLLSKMFFKQADEEREHAMKFLRYIIDTSGHVEVPAVEAPQATFESVEEIFKLSLDWELDITQRINRLMTLAREVNDNAAQEFLRWFVTEQVEEVKTMDDMLKIARAVGERNVIMVEAYLVHQD